MYISSHSCFSSLPSSPSLVNLFTDSFRVSLSFHTCILLIPDQQVEQSGSFFHHHHFLASTPLIIYCYRCTVHPSPPCSTSHSYCCVLGLVMMSVLPSSTSHAFCGLLTIIGLERYRGRVRWKRASRSLWMVGGWSTSSNLIPSYGQVGKLSRVVSNEIVNARYWNVSIVKIVWNYIYNNCVSRFPG